MGCPAARSRVPVDLSRAVGCKRAGFKDGGVSAEAASLQITGDVGCGEANQRRRLLVEPERARLSLLVATITHNFRMVGRPTPQMVQRILSRILSGRRNH